MLVYYRGVGTFSPFSSFYLVISAFCVSHMLSFLANKMVQHIQSSYSSCFIPAQSMKNTTNRKLTWARRGTGPTVVLISGKSTSTLASNNRSKAKSTGHQSKLDSVSLPLRLDYPFHGNEIIQKKKKCETIKISEYIA